MTEKSKVSRPFNGAADQMTVRHLRDTMARADSMTVSHLGLAMQKVEKQLTVAHLAPALGSGNAPPAPAQGQSSQNAGSTAPASGGAAKK
jgi:hypothetical protein